MTREVFQMIPEIHSGDPSRLGIRVPFVRPALPSAESLQPAFDEIIVTGARAARTTI